MTNSPFHPTRREFLGLAAGAAAASVFSGPGFAESSGKPLNFLVIMADDLGAKELGCYGSGDHKTPNLDALAQTGTRFETCWATPLCSPTRVELMTGRYAFRTGWYNFLGRETTPMDHLQPDEITFADVLGAGGYATGLAGKWQLGLITKQPTMIFDSGFDEYFTWAWNVGGLPKDAKFEGSPRQRYWHPAIIENGKHVPTTPDQYGPDLYSDWIVRFMERHKDGPFLAYYPMCLIHPPWDPTPDSSSPTGKTEGGLKPNVEYMDTIIGRVVKALDDLGLRENTVVFFTGDNGTAKDGKGTVTERGVRVPMIVNCPGLVQSGVVSKELIDLSDVLPTLADLAGAALPQGVNIDGRSFAPLLRGEQGNPRGWIFSYLAYERMIRDKRWLLEGDGRLFDCGECRDGSAYRDVTHSDDPEALAARRKFVEILNGMPAPKKAGKAEKDSTGG